MVISRVVRIHGYDIKIEQRCNKDDYRNEYSYYINDEEVHKEVIKELISDLYNLLNEE